MSDFKEKGALGVAVFGGYIDSGETNSALSGSNRFKTAADILANISVVAASVRYFLNLLANPQWRVMSADDTPAGKQAAEFVESVMEEMASSWTRIVRRSGSYRFHGFGFQEWTAVKRTDGLIGFTDVEVRAQHTIDKWDVLDNGTVRGVWQRSPQTGAELYLPRERLVYLRDDTLTDSPEGMGWFRHLVEPSERLKEYLTLEKVGFERDLAGVPVGKAPITALNRAVKAGNLSSQEANDMMDGLKNFVKMEVKKQNTGIVLDSQPFENQSSDGVQAASTPQWGVDLLTSDAGNIQELGDAIHRISVEMARIIGTEILFIGSDGKGSMALSKDKSNNLFLNVNGTLDEMVETFTRDLIQPLWRLNGFDPEIMPHFTHEDVAVRDAEQISITLRNMASAGAVLGPDDPAINDLRDMLGISRALPFEEEDDGVEDDNDSEEVDESDGGSDSDGAESEADGSDGAEGEGEDDSGQ
jgi:hypothetical protein